MGELFSNFIVVAGQVFTLFLMMGAGFVLRKLKKLSDRALSDMTFILLFVVSPCLIVDAMQIERNANALRSMGFAALGCVIFFAIEIVVTSFLFRKKSPDTRDVLRFGSMYPNAGFMGFPLVRAVLGESAMLSASVFLIVFQLFHWTHGVVLMGGREKASIKSALFNPGTLGFVAGLLLFALNLRLPWPVGNAVGFVADINTPIAMFVIGAQMADADILRLFRVRELYASTALRLALFPALTALALLPLGFPPLVYCAVVILSAAPSAGVTSMFAQRFGRDTATAARLVSLATLLSILTLPVFAALAQWIAAR
ncbi:MAG: AEC family transporter [Oscillospiraceae bacterium]|jgi:predicted permease|nr:AEC family transporter [Oscillospiraceae bacterium]